MATEPSKIFLKILYIFHAESTPQRRQRRLKQDPQFIFEHPTETKIDTPSISNNQTKPIHPIDKNPTGADLHKPDDIFWSKLSSFSWLPALIVC
jgi:hypothetical protein